MRRWVDECWSRIAPDVPLVAICWGWEHYATWVHPNSFPCNPSDEAFVSLVSDFAAKNIHAFPWPSGYNWTLSYGTNEAGVVQYDWRRDFMRETASHACVTRDGKVVERTPFWLHGGAYAKMCGGDDWTRRWFSQDVAGELAKRGCKIVSVDQNNGGMWKTVAARQQLIDMADAIRKIHGKSAVTYEDPNEQFNDLSALQLQRDTKWKGEWASVYNYVYHEYMPVFQAEPRSRIDLRWMAYSAAEGQMPRIVPQMCDIETDDPKLAAQRKFEAWYPGYMKRWISLFRGEGRPWLAYGRRIKPPQLVCGSVSLKGGGTAPAVFIAAYESEDGRRALVLANATADTQSVRCVWPGGKTMEFKLEPRDLRLIKENSGQSTAK